MDIINLMVARIFGISAEHLRHMKILMALVGIIKSLFTLISITNGRIGLRGVQLRLKQLTAKELKQERVTA